MPLTLTCPGCGKRLRAPDQLAGKSVNCPNCQQKLVVPSTEDEAATYLLESETADLERTRPAVPEPALPRSPLSPGGRKRPTTPRRVPQPLAPLTTNEPPGWLRHLHWLLILALLPLAFSLLGGEESAATLDTRLERTLEQAPPESRQRIAFALDELEQGHGSIDRLFDVLPGHRFAGAWLARDSAAHWAFAAGSAILFLAFFALLASHGTAQPLHLLGIGLFTATVGILLLLLFQLLADWSQGMWFTGRSILVIVFYVVKLIGWSYRAALDPENGLFLSFLGFTLGVGLCEEVCKALPLLWHYRDQSSQSWRTAFVWGLASGAGFGVAEGILYAGRTYNGISGPETYLVRFISCVALHALWTGSVGITMNQRQELFRKCSAWHEWIAPIFFVVSIPMVLHGLYDTLLKREMHGAALAVAVLSFGWLAFQVSRLRTGDDQAAKEKMLREYQRRRLGVS